MWRVAVRGSLLIVALLAVSIALSACGSSDQPAEQQTAASGSAKSAAPFAAGQSVTVTYTDDGSSGVVPATDVPAIPDTTFAVGDRVLAVWSKGRFCPGEVSKVEGTTYSVKWDDGRRPSTVEAGKIIAE